MELDEALARIKELEETNTAQAAKLEETIKHSREWETRAKANKAKADELEQLKAQDAERAKQLAELQAYKDSAEAAKERSALAAKVSEETGVPADLLVGEDEEAMRSYAGKLDQYAHPKPAGMPNQGSTPDVAPKDEQARQFVNGLFDQIK